MLNKINIIWIKKILIAFFVLLLVLVNIDFTYSFSNQNKTHTINLLIKHTDSRISIIEKVLKKYDIEKSKEIKEKIKELREIRNLLIQINRTWKHKKHIKNIVEKLRINNDFFRYYIKEKIKNKRLEVRQYSIIYSKRIDPVLNKIDTIVINIASTFIQKNKISSKDKQIINLLYQIKQKTDNLKKLNQNNFNTRKELQNYIINTFNQIILNFKQIKNIVRN